MSNIIVMAFSPRNIVGYFLKKKAYKGGSQAPQELPLATPLRMSQKIDKGKPRFRPMTSLSPPRRMSCPDKYFSVSVVNVSEL